MKLSNLARQIKRARKRLHTYPRWMRKLMYFAGSNMGP